MTNSQFTTVTDIKPLAQARGWDYRIAAPPTRQQQDVSRTIEEEIIDFLHRGQQDIEAYMQIHGGSWVSHLKHLSRLHSIYDYAVPETFTCTVPFAEIIERDGLVVTSENEILVQSLTQKTALQAKYVFAASKPDQRKTVHSPGKHVSLLCFGAQNYYHWFFDGLLRLSLFDHQDTSFKVVIPANPAAFIRESLQLLGIAEDRMVVMGKQKLAVDELVLAYPEEMSAKPKRVHLLEHRRRLLAAAEVDSTTTLPDRNLYISRANSTRPIVNETELLPILDKYDFEIVFCENLSVVEQIALFAEAKCILGAHGAGFANVLFSKPGTIMIDLFNRKSWNDCYLKVGASLGHTHWHLFAENEEGNGYPSRVDPTRLDKLLRYALG